MWGLGERTLKSSGSSWAPFAKQKGRLVREFQHHPGASPAGFSNLRHSSCHFAGPGALGPNNSKTRHRRPAGMRTAPPGGCSKAARGTDRSVAREPN